MQQKHYLSSLDGLRGLCAAAVVFSNLRHALDITAPWMNLMVGDESVALFFVLSGFLMAYVYGDRPFTLGNITEYLVHRLARIYPVYLAAVLLVVVISFVPELDYFQPINTPGQIFRHVVMFGSTGGFWSIPPEIQFYGFFLVIWLFFSNPKSYRWIGILLAFFMAVDATLGFPGPGILLLSKIQYFLIGTAAGWLFSGQRQRPQSALLGIALLVLLTLFFLTSTLLETPTAFWGLSSAFAASVIVYLAAWDAPIARTVLQNPVLMFLGRISFSLYLFHMPVLFIVAHLLYPTLSVTGAVLAGVLASVLVSVITYLLIERPARRIVYALWAVHRARTPVAA